MRERWLTAYTVNFHALFLGRSYIWSLLNQFITLIRSSCSKKKKKGGVCVCASSLLWSIWDDTDIPMLSHVEISPFCWSASKLLSTPLNLSSAMLLPQMCLIWYLTLVERASIHLKYFYFWFLVTKPSGTRKFAHLADLWDGLWHVFLLLLQAFSPHETRGWRKILGWES